HFYQLHEEPFDFWRPTPHALRFFGEAAGLQCLEIVTAGDAWDLFGTALSTVTTAPREETIMARGVTKLLGLGSRCLVGLLRRGWLQRYTRLEGPLYLSNVATFARTGGASGDGELP